MKLTTRIVDGLSGPPLGSTSKARQVSDSEVTGLNINCSISGRKFWAFHYSIHGQRRKAPLGEYPAISLQEARQTALEMRAAVNRGIDPLEQRDRIRQMPTFAQFTQEEYIPWAKEHKRSWDMDDSKLRHHLVPKFGNRRLCDITTRDIQMYHAQIKNSHCAATANRHLALLSKIFRTAIAWQRIETRNPCQGVAKFREAQTKFETLTQVELTRMLAAMDEEPNIHAVAALKLLLLTGTRREEALQARWEHIDLDGARWFLPKTKNGKTRHVVLNSEALELLRKHRLISNGDWVFPGRDPSKPLNNPRKAFTRILKAAGLPHMRIHGLRHVAASIAAAGGASLYQIQTLLGQSSTAMAARYSHLTDESIRKASALVSDIYTKAKEEAKRAA